MTEKPHSEITLQFGGGDAKFCLPWSMVAEWERAGNHSLCAIFNQLEAGRGVQISHIRDIVHMGLVGGGMTPPEATNMVRMWVENRPLTESQLVAFAVCGAFLHGVGAEANGD